MEKIGFFGGCFNPVTNAHIELIAEAIKQENLDKVYFVPMGDLYEKKDLISLKHRIKMLELAFENQEKMTILAISNKDKKTCAIDTFQKIDEKFPKDERFFIMGSDNYENMAKWKNAEDLIKNYQYIILDREKGKRKDISSSMVREKIKQNENVENLIPQQVLEYIKQKNLYK